MSVLVNDCGQDFEDANSKLLEIVNVVELMLLVDAEESVEDSLVEISK